MERDILGSFKSMSYDNNTDFVSSSSDSFEFIMELYATPQISFFKEVLTLGSIYLEDDWINKF